MLAYKLFNSHLNLAHNYWKQLLQPGDLVVDATCGNGHDTAFLASLNVQLMAYDIQATAIEKAKERLNGYPCQFTLGSHENFHEVPDEQASLIVYNLGYLPGGDKNLTTLENTTLKSIQNGLNKLRPGGALSITCYPGHPEGELEEKALTEWSSHLSPFVYNVAWHRFLNRNKAPSLLLIQKGF